MNDRDYIEKETKLVYGYILQDNDLIIKSNYTQGYLTV